MGPGSVPPLNSTKAGAIEIDNSSFWTIVSNTRSIQQATSYYPYYDQIPPPPEEPQPGPPPIFFDLWYKFKYGTSFPASQFPVTVLTATAWNVGGPTRTIPPPNPVRPGYPNASVITVYDEADNVIITGKRVMFTADKNQYYYIKIVTPPSLSYSNAVKFQLTEIFPSAIRKGTIYVQESNTNYPITALPTGYNYQNARNFIFPRSGHSLGGGAGDILPNGVSCIMDYIAGGVSVYPKNFHPIIATFPLTGGIHNIKRDGAGNSFWISYSNAGVGVVRQIKVDEIIWEGDIHTGNYTATLGPPLGITAPVDRLCARNNDVLYYVLVGSYAVKRWNVITNTAVPDLTGERPDLGIITDVLVLPNSNVAVSYTSGAGLKIAVYDGVTGVMNLVFEYDSSDIYNRMNYSEDPTDVYIWTHETSGQSVFRKIRLTDGVVTRTTRTKDFQAGVYIKDTDLYDTDGTILYPIQEFGAPYLYNFFIATVSHGAGLYYPPSPPPDDEFYPPVLQPLPPYEFPPSEQPSVPGQPPPVITPPVDPVKVGGGLIIIDPSNITRHDEYLSKTGESIQSAIKVTIRTAFLGS